MRVIGIRIVAGWAPVQQLGRSIDDSPAHRIERFTCDLARSVDRWIGHGWSLRLRRDRLANSGGGRLDKILPT